MTQRRKSVDWGSVAKVAGALALGGTALYYLREGAGSKKTSVLIPKSIEDRLDVVVDMLDQKYGETWVNMGLQFLQKALADALPPPLVALIDFIQKAERLGLQNKWSGAQKRSHAVSLATS